MHYDRRFVGRRAAGVNSSASDRRFVGDCGVAPPLREGSIRRSAGSDGAAFGTTSRCFTGRTPGHPLTGGMADARGGGQRDQGPTGEAAGNRVTGPLGGCRTARTEAQGARLSPSTRRKYGGLRVFLTYPTPASYGGRTGGAWQHHGDLGAFLGAGVISVFVAGPLLFFRGDPKLCAG